MEADVETLEVRCCCDPSKLLGHLPLPATVPYAFSGLVVKFALRPTRGPVFLQDVVGEVSLEIGVLQQARPVPPGFEDVSRFAVRSWLAFNSNETPIETLRRIPGFVEYRGPEF